MTATHNCNGVCKLSVSPCIICPCYKCLVPKLSTMSLPAKADRQVCGVLLLLLLSSDLCFFAAQARVLHLHA